MITDEGGTLTSANDFLQQLSGCGFEPLNNSLIAGRMPPGDECAMHPAGYRAEFTGSDSLFKVLQAGLGDPLPNLTEGFNRAAGISSPKGAPSTNPILGTRA